MLLHNWLIENNCKHVCMESTEKYWIPIFNYLEQDIDICLTHPKYFKSIKGKKTAGRKIYLSPLSYSSMPKLILHDLSSRNRQIRCCYE